MFGRNSESISPEEYEAYKERGRIEEEKRREKRARNLENTQHTDCSFKEYCAVFDLEPNELKDKMILDVGSGTRESFSKEAAKYGAKVVSLSPELKKWFKRRLAKGVIFPDKRWQKASVAARAQEMPFAEESFDYVLASWSVPYYSLDEKDGNLSVEEMIRVLKPGGKLGLYPFAREKTENLDEIIEKYHCTVVKDDAVLIIEKANAETPEVSLDASAIV